MTVRQPWHWLVYGGALGLCVALVLGVLWRVYTYPAPLDPPRTLHVSDDAPCTIERYRLGCERWGTRATPCVVTPLAGEVVATTYPGPERGAHGVASGALRDELAVRRDRCGRHDPTVEHEMCHALYGLPHHHGVGVCAELPENVRMP